MIKFFAQKPPVVCNSGSSYIRVFNPEKMFQPFSPALETVENEAKSGGCVIFRIPLAVNNKDVVTKP